MVDEKELCVEVREHLEESLPGTGGGRNPHDHLLVDFLFLLPVFILLFCYYRSFKQFANGARSMVPDYLGGISVLICFVAAVVSLGFGFSVVPRQVKPWTGLILMYEWIFTIFFLLFGCYLHMIYKWGEMVASQTGNRGPGASDYDSEKGLFIYL
ncbi:putative glucuronosyltransferase [Helianthus annuus]|uniref:Glucuronosyltransferase n=1 Tax=Helianthus annuus TaxID=4232 RepID=A0A251VN87_HELAN|nr:putative glucuronosyltransferase [Helianthus annuus]KAJ0626653.1 putative glucuronosyltransferase [Helianthus annuus]KAJ0956628.1 putative glucuronosyltransferase [Helianthus annuus]